MPQRIRRARTVRINILTMSIGTLTMPHRLRRAYQVRNNIFTMSIENLDYAATRTVRINILTMSLENLTMPHRLRHAFQVRVAILNMSIVKLFTLPPRVRRGLRGLLPWPPCCYLSRNTLGAPFSLEVAL